MLLRATAQVGQAAGAAPEVSTASGVGQGDSLKTPDATSKPNDRKPESNAGRTAKHSAGVDEILNMVQSGVSAEVIKVYIENSSVAYSLSATDVIALKEHGVPDELTTAMMKRGAALIMQVRQSQAFAMRQPADPASSRRSYRLDPESYDYFQYYYLYPRTLAAANQRFYSSDAFSPGFAPYGYGSYQPPVFWPVPPSAFGRP